MTDQSLKIKTQQILISILFFILFFYLIFNIASSQVISPLFERILNGDKTATVEYLKKIKHEPQFGQELQYYKKKYGVEIENAVFKDEKIREEKIAEYKSILQKNPKSRDLLYGLYLLYRAGGNEKKAGEYLNKAKEVDPEIK